MEMYTFTMCMASGGLVWIMGLPGVGKTECTKIICDSLSLQIKKIVWLDGDVLRNALSLEGHTKNDRISAGLKYLRLSQVLVNQGYLVLLSSVGMQKDFESYARKEISNYFQVLLLNDVEKLDQLKERSFYKVSDGNVMGIDIIPDQLSYDLTVRNDRLKSLNQVASEIMEGIQEWLKSKK